MRPIRALCVITLAPLAAQAGAQTIWTGGAGSGDWLTAQNWSTNKVPSPGDAVVIPAGFPGGVSSPGVFVQSLSAMSPLSVGGGGTGVANDAFLKTFSTTGGFVCGGSAVFTGDVSVQTSYFWQAVNGFQSTGNFKVTNLPLALTVFANEGTMTVQDGNLTLGGAAVTLNNSGTLELKSNGNIFSSGTLNNSGTFRKVGAFPSEVQCRVLNSSTTPITVSDGLLRLTGGGSYASARFNIELGAALRLEGPFVANSHTFAGFTRFDGDGELEIQCGVAGAIVFPQPVTAAMFGPDGLHFQSGGVILNTALTNRGKFTWAGGTIYGPNGIVHNFKDLVVPAGKSASIKGGCDLRNYDTATIAGVLSIDPGDVVLNFSDLILSGEIRGAVPGQGLVRNRSTPALLRVTAGAGVAKIQPRFQQDEFASTFVESGTLILLGGGEFGPSLDSEFQTSQPGTLLAFDAGTFDVTSKEHTILTNGETRIRGGGTRINVAAAGGITFAGDGITYLELGAQIGGPGKAINNGTFVWKSQIGIDGTANFRNEAPGVVLIQSGTLRGSFTNDTGALVKQTSTLSMFNSVATNDGEWFIEPPNTSPVNFVGTNAQFVNGPFAILEAKAPPGAGRTANSTITLDNQGTVRATGGITLNIGGQIIQLQNGVLDGGTWEAINGGKLVLLGSPPITTVTNTSITGSKASMPWLAGVKTIENAHVTITEDTAFTGPLQVGGNGQPGSTVTIEPCTEVTVPGGTTVGEPAAPTLSNFENQPGSCFAGPSSLITPILTMHGGIRPGGPDQPSRFNLTGNLSMQPGGAIEVELGGVAPEAGHDVVTITGSAALDGTLDVSLLPGFAPEPGQTFEIMTATGGINGTFAAILQPTGLPPNLHFEAVYSASSVTLVAGAPCYPDCDQSGSLDIFDFLCFLNQFNVTGSYADCDKSGTYNVFDFLCFQNAFTAGCP